METHGITGKPIVIIGGGVSGALTAYHLVREQVRRRIVVVNPAPSLGLGLAYSTPSLRHLLNVPAGKISALPGEPEHFLRWLKLHHDPEATESTFAPRAIFGRYLQSLLQSIHGIEHEMTSVVSLETIDGGARLRFEDGRQMEASHVVLALGNFDPAELPGISAQAKKAGLYQHNAWSAAAFQGLDPDAPVTLIGTGLTAVDVVLRLRELGHRGTITAVSRHGVFPNRHDLYLEMEHSAIPAGTPATCLAYLRAFRKALAEGAEWRAAVDSLRATTNDLWLALPLNEQRRFRRHLQRRWDVVRHRMAPPIADLIEGELRAGTLQIREGSLAAIEQQGEQAVVTLRTHSGQEQITAARAINCTGPGMNYRRVASPLLASLFAQGAISAGPLGTGLRCAANGAVLDASGRESTLLYNLGPGRLGTLLESIAVPEIRSQAVDLAATLARALEGQEPQELTVTPTIAPYRTTTVRAEASVVTA